MAPQSSTLHLAEEWFIRICSSLNLRFQFWGWKEISRWSIYSGSGPMGMILHRRGVYCCVNILKAVPFLWMSAVPQWRPLIPTSPIIPFVILWIFLFSLNSILSLSSLSSSSSLPLFSGLSAAAIVRFPPWRRLISSPIITQPASTSCTKYQVPSTRCTVKFNPSHCPVPAVL